MASPTADDDDDDDDNRDRPVLHSPFSGDSISYYDRASELIARWISIRETMRASERPTVVTAAGACCSRRAPVILQLPTRTSYGAASWRRKRRRGKRMTRAEEERRNLRLTVRDDKDKTDKASFQSCHDVRLPHPRRFVVQQTQRVCSLSSDYCEVW